MLRGTILAQRNSLASNVFVYTKTLALQELVGPQPKPSVLHRADAGFAFFQNALSALRRSAQPSRAVMFTGIGIVSQQAEHARQIFNTVRVLAFVRTKALLAGAIHNPKLVFCGKKKF